MRAGAPSAWHIEVVVAGRHAASGDFRKIRRPGPCPPTGCHTLAVGESGAWDAVWLPLPLLDDTDADLRGGAVDGLDALVEGGLRLWERHPVAWAPTAQLAAGGDDVRRTRDAFAGLAQAVPAVRRLAGRVPGGLRGGPGPRRSRCWTPTTLATTVPATTTTLATTVPATTYGASSRDWTIRTRPSAVTRHSASRGGRRPAGSCRRAAVERARPVRSGACDTPRRLRRAATEALEALGRVTDT
ncbi:hypothetical protein [Streptomyces phaeoluteigriseus]|uniref:hypothetical protein n=1 Tax=Streptomyces phaeoluteigriseus TaxID=114686 RepID=UPI0036B13A60